MDVNRDELRRQLAESRRDQAEAMPRFREALKKLFDPDRAPEPGDDQAKAALLGLPSRRTFLTVGGAAVAGSALLAGCGQPKSPTQIAQTGTTPVQPSSTTTTDPTSKTNDLIMLRTSSSIEVLAIGTYQSALKSGTLDSSTKEVVSLFISQHQQHLAELQSLTTAQGGEAYDQPNFYLKYELVDPTLLSTKTQDAWLALATQLENTASQTYSYAGGVMTTPDLRGALMSIGATEARHLTVLYIAQGDIPVPLALGSTAKAVIPDAWILASGPAKPKDLLPTPTTAGAG